MLSVYQLNLQKCQCSAQKAQVATAVRASHHPSFCFTHTQLQSSLREVLLLNFCIPRAIAYSCESTTIVVQLSNLFCNHKFVKPSSVTRQLYQQKAAAKQSVAHTASQ